MKYEPKTGAAMKLEVGPSERSSELLALPSESGYENADKVTFSMTLTQVKGSDTTTLRSLSVPVLITLPVPENISMKNVLVLHYSARGVYDKKLTAASITNSSRTIAVAAPIAWAQQNGILGGYAGGIFRPDNSTTRQALWMVLARMSGASPAGLSGYSDNSAVANYAREALAWGVANGIITGTNDGRLNPQGTATRAHFAAFLYRYASL